MARYCEANRPSKRPPNLKSSPQGQYFSPQTAVARYCEANRPSKRTLFRGSGPRNMTPGHEIRPDLLEMGHFSTLRTRNRGPGPRNRPSDVKSRVFPEKDPKRGQKPSFSFRTAYGRSEACGKRRGKHVRPRWPLGKRRNRRLFDEIVAFSPSWTPKSDPWTRNRALDLEIDPWTRNS